MHDGDERTAEDKVEREEDAEVEDRGTEGVKGGKRWNGGDIGEGRGRGG